MAEQEFESSYITTPEQEDLSEILEPLEIPFRRLEKSFMVKIKPFTMAPLKKAFEMLIDSDFNPTKTAFLQVNKDGLEITVRNQETNIMGTIFLKAEYMVGDFYCYTDIKLMSNNILTSLLEAIKEAEVNSYKETATLYGLVDEPMSLYLDFGDSRYLYKLFLIQVEGDGISIVNQRLACRARLRSEALTHIFSHMIDGSVSRVGFKLTDTSVEVSLEKGSIWEQLIHSETNTRKIEPGETYDLCFSFPHLSILAKMADIDEHFHLVVGEQPSNMVGIITNIHPIGHTSYFMQAATVIKSP